jgi:hypothetical protein
MGQLYIKVGSPKSNLMRLYFIIIILYYIFFIFFVAVLTSYRYQNIRTVLPCISMHASMQHGGVEFLFILVIHNLGSGSQLPWK